MRRKTGKGHDGESQLGKGGKGIEECGLSVLVYVIDSSCSAARMEALPDGHKKQLGKVKGGKVAGREEEKVGR